MASLQSTSVNGTLSATGAVTLSNYGAGFVKLNASGAIVIDTNSYLTSGSFLPLSGGTMSGIITTVSSGTAINFSGQSDSFGYNATSGLGTYIKGTGSTYIYGGGSFYDGSVQRAILHAGNYNSYSPTLTGGGASGTWGISITGNAATVGGYGVSTSVGANTVVVRDANNYIYAYYINSSVSESENPTINSFFTSNGDGWLRKSSIAHVRNQLGNYGGWITGYTETDTLATVTARGASTSAQMQQNSGRYVRDSNYRTISGFSDYYGGGSAGWYKVAQITLTGNCSGAVLFGTLNDNRYDGADAYQISVVARAECDFTSNNESHYINVGCTILGSTNYSNYQSKIRVLLVASSSGSRTYELQFYETPWNHDTWELQTTGWSIYSSPQAPGSSTGTARVNYISKQNADYTYNNVATYSPIYYDSNDTNYYVNPASTSKLVQLNLGTTNTSLVADVATGYVKIYGTAGNYLAIGPYNNNGWAYQENFGNSNGTYYYVQAGRHAFDGGDLTPYGDAARSLGTGSYRWSQVFTSGWFRSYGAQGMYNQDYGTHFYSSGSGSWNVTGSGGNVELVFRSNHQSTIRGYVYGDTGNNIGFLNSSGGWAVRADSSSNVQIYGDLTVGNTTSSNIYMTDTDETTRRIHTNSGRIGFLNSSNGWGAWCDNNGSWGVSSTIYTAGTLVEIQGAGGQVSFKDSANVWTGYVGFSGNTGILSFPGRNVTITSGYNGTIELNTGTSGYNSGSVNIPYGSLNVSNNSITTGGYLYTNYSVRVGEIWGGGGLYRSSGTMYFGTENAGWSFRYQNSEKFYIGTDGNIWMSWLGDYISNRIGQDVRSSASPTFSSIYTNGGLSTNGGNSLLGVQSPGGASRANGGSTETGAFKITLPSGIPVYGMFKLVIHIYEYGQRGNGYEIHCGGHMYPNYMYNRFQVQYGSSNSPLNVRYGNDGTNGCIWIGDTNTTWSYPQIWVSEFMMGYSNTSWTTWRSGWSISLVTSYGNSGAMDGPYTCDYGYAASAGSASTSSQVTINYNDNSNANYQLLWGSGNNVYGTSGVYVNPYDDRVYANYFSSAYYMDVYTSAGSDYLRITDNQVYRPGGGGLYLNWSSNANVFITGSGGGYIGVGNNSPSYKLHVSGDIYANGGWLRVSGSSGLYFESYGGGWRMTGSSYIESYGSKSLHMNGASVDYVGSLYFSGAGHIQPNSGSYGALQMTSSKNGWSGIRFTDSNVNLMVNSNESGFHNNGYGWQFFWSQGTAYVHRSTYGGGTQYTVLDSGNYNSWAPGLTGGGASGTWGISITGSSATSTQTYRGIVEDTRAAQRTPNDYDDYRVSWEFSNQITGVNYGGSSWWSLMTIQGWHNGYSAWQIIGPSSSAVDNFYLRTGNNTSWNTVREIIHSGNIGSQSVSYASSAGNADTVDGYHASGLWKLNEWNGNLYAHTDGRIYGTIFYDSNNDAYYVNPNGTSRLNNLQLNETYTPSYTGQLILGSTSYNFNFLNGSWAGSITAGILANCSDQWEFAIHDSGHRVVSPFLFDGGGNHRLLMGRDIGWGQMYIEAASSFRAPIFYDSNNTTYFWDGSAGKSMEVAGGVQLDGLNNSNAYIAFNNASTYWGIIGNYGANDWRIGIGNYSSLTDWNLRWDASGNAWANSSFRAPIFYDSQDTNYYVDPNSTSRVLRMQPLNLGGATLQYRSTDLAVDSGSREAITFIDGSQVQAHVSTGNGCGGCCYNWWSSESVQVDPEKDYEFHVWVRSTGNDNVYLGWWEGDSSGNTITSNPYFHTGGINTGGTWVKLTAKLKNWRTTSPQGNSNGQDRYASASNMSNDYTGTVDGVMHSNTRFVYIRLGTCYGTVSGSKTYFYGAQIREAGYDDYQQNFVIPYYNGSSWGGKLRFGLNDWGYFGIGMYGAAGEFRMSSDSGDLNLRVDGWIQSEASVRAPIFYDSQNTGYYLDPAGSSQLSSVYANDWFRPQGCTGVYFQDYGRGLRAADCEGSYGNVMTYGGGVNGYAGWGLKDASGYRNYFMGESGNVGIYAQDLGLWTIYWSRTNACLGIGTSTTNSAYSIYTNKGHYVNYSGTGVTGYYAYHTGGIGGGGIVEAFGAQWTTYGASFVIGYKQGELSPGDMCHIYNSGGFYMKIYDGSTNRFHRWDDNGSVSINSSSQGSYTFNVTGDIYATGDVIAYSDARVKENVATVENALEKVSKLRGVTYTRKEGEDKSTKLGVIAQEVLEVLPEVVHEDDHGYYSVAYGNIVGVLIEAIKEQQKQIDELKDQLKKQ